MKNLWLLLALAFFPALAPAQTIAVSKPVSDDGHKLVVKLSYEHSDPDFTPHDCHWYVIYKSQELWFHDGCDTTERPIDDSQAHVVVMIANGHSKPKPDEKRDEYALWIDQRSDVVILTVQERVKVEHKTFRPENLEPKN